MTDKMLAGPGGGRAVEAPWLRAFDDPGLRGIRVLPDYQVEVEPWPKAVKYGPCVNGGRTGGVLRTKGDPASMRSMMEEHGEFIIEAANRFLLPPAWVAAMCGIEAVRGHGMRWDTKSCREEPKFISDLETPRKVSPGPMQTLISTAEGERKKRFPDWPPIRTRDQLFDQYTSFMIGAGYMKTQVDRYGLQPVMICAGYNAGSARRSTESEWGVKTYDPRRVTKMLAWINDFTAVMVELGLDPATGVVWRDV